MSPPKGGYGGIEIPSDIPPSSDPAEQLLRDAARALRAAERKFEELSREFDRRTASLETKVGVLHGEVSGLSAKLSKQSEDISTILLLQSAAKSAWNRFGGQIIAYGIALLAGGWGIGKATTEKPAPPPVVHQSSPFDKLVDECRKLSDYPPNNVTGMSPRVDCLVRVSKEQFAPR